MKITLALLLCMAAASCQQMFVWPKSYDLRPYLVPFYYSQENPPAPPPYYLPAPGGGGGEEQVGPRAAFNRQENRLFGWWNPFTRVTVTVTSSILTAVVSTCIPANQFSSSGSTLFTNPCARRRRHAGLEHSGGSIVAPSQLQKMEASAAAGTPSGQSAFEIESSLLEVLDAPSAVAYRRDRQGANLVTNMATSTVYVFNSTVVKKTINIGNTNQLLCLPNGFAVC